MTLSNLPPELWLQILSFLPHRYLQSIRGVNRVFYDAAQARFLRILDVLPPANKTIKERMAWSLHNIERASCDYKCVRAIKFSPHLGTLEAIPTASNSSGGLTKVPLAWNQMFSFVKELRLQPGLSSTASRVLSVTAKEVEDRLMALLPRLDNLHELFIVDQHQRNVFPDNLDPGPCSTTTLAFACFAPRLTLLSLNLFSQVILRSYLPDRNSFSLPLLQTFRVKFSKYTFPSENDQAAVMGLIQRSPLLMELEYSIADSDWAWSQHLILLADPLLHPKLRVFKWATEQEYFYENTTVAAPLLPGLTKFLTLFNAQLRVLHFNPALSAGMGALLNFTLLSELHLDLTFCSTIEQEKLVSVHLPSAPCLCTLELRGETVPFTRFGKLIPLKKFYLCISAKTFAWNLALLAGIAPNLRFLNVVFNQGNLGCSLETDVNAAVHELRNTQRLLEWALWDFSLFTGDLSISQQKSFFQALSKIVPSVQSFCGTGSLRIPMNGFLEDKDICGELWKIAENRTARSLPL